MNSTQTPTLGALSAAGLIFDRMMINDPKVIATAQMIDRHTDAPRLRRENQALREALRAILNLPEPHIMPETEMAMRNLARAALAQCEKEKAK